MFKAHIFYIHFEIIILTFYWVLYLDFSIANPKQFHQKIQVVLKNLMQEKSLLLKR